MPATNKLRMDKSRYHSTIHGERTPDDPHAGAVYYQDGIFFDAHGLHMEHLLTDETRPVVERKLKKQAKVAPKQEADAGDDDDQDASDPDTDKVPGSQDSDVNLASWLRGEANYPWFQIQKAMRERYHQNVTGRNSKFDVVVYLIEDIKLVSEDELAPEFRAVLARKAA